MSADRIRLLSCAAALVLAFALSLASNSALASAQRTFVASTGNDANAANNCSLVLPCRSFAAAMVQTQDGGEIVVLDSAGYAAVTIDHSVSIIAPQGLYAGITAFSGNAITIAGTALRVVLRGLTLNTFGPVFANIGINIEPVNDSEILIERVAISGFSQFGIAMGFGVASNRTRLHVLDSDIRVHASGLLVNGFSDVLLERVRISADDGSGVYVGLGANVHVRDSIVDGGGGANAPSLGTYGLYVETNAPRITPVLVERGSIRGFMTGVHIQAVMPGVDRFVATISDSVISDNDQGIETLCLNAGAGQLSIVDSTIANSGVRGSGSGDGVLGTGSGCALTLSHNVITGNSGTSMVSSGAGSFATFGDNRVRGNGTDTPSGTVTAVPTR